MNKLLAIFLLVSATASAQTIPNYTRINSGYNWLRGAFDALNVPADSTARFKQFQWQRSGAMVYDSTGSDKGLKVFNGTTWEAVGAVPTWQQTVNTQILQGNTSIDFAGGNWVLNNLEEHAILAEGNNFLQSAGPTDTAEVGTTSGTAFMSINGNVQTMEHDSTRITKRISYASNINGSLTANSLVTKGYADSIAGRKRFGVSGEDDVATANRQFEIGDYNFTFFSENGFNKKVLFDLQSAAFLVESDARVSLEGSDSIVLTNQNNGENMPTRSEIGIYNGQVSSKGITMKPWQGKLIIDTLYTTSVTTGKLMMLHDTVTGNVWRTPLPAAGVTSSTSTDNAIARYDGTTGQMIQNSTVLIDDNGRISSGVSGTAGRLALYGGQSTMTDLDNMHLYFRRSGTGVGAGFYFDGVAISDMYMGGAIGSDDIVISRANQFTNELFRFTNSGRLGIGTSSPSKLLDVNGTTNLGGSVYYAIRTVTANASAATTDRTILVDATSGNLTISLPAVTGTSGVEYVVKKIDATANTVTIQASGAEVIDGTNTKVLTAQWQSNKLQSNGSAWYVIP